MFIDTMRIVEMKYSFLYLILFVLFSSCSGNREIAARYEKWINREIIFPSDMVFTIQLRDTVSFPFNKTQYKLLTHIDSIGCVSCKLQLDKWKKLMVEVDSLTDGDMQFLYFFSPERLSDVAYHLKINNFDYPVCVDLKDSLDILNNFPKDDAFNTFLLDKDNRVIAIGNPIHNLKIKELYLKIIQGQPIGEEKDTIQTQVVVPETSFTFGDFSWQEAQTHSFEVKNTGSQPLVIQDVTTSCGCITVDFTKEPVQPGSTAMVTVTYKADRAEYFNKTITIYGNAEQLPIQLHVSGNAK